MEYARNEGDLEAARERALDLLSSNYAADRLSMEEYETRAAAASRAVSRARLQELLDDLPAANLPAAAARAPSPRFDEDRIIPAGEERGSSLVVSIFAGSNRAGSWRAPRTMYVLSVFGGSHIDLRKARVPREGVKIRVLSVFGGASVVVPPDLGVRTAGFGLFGGFGGPHDREGEPGAPTISVSGLAVFGGAGVTVKD